MSIIAENRLKDDDLHLTADTERKRECLRECLRRMPKYTRCPAGHRFTAVTRGYRFADFVNRSPPETFLWVVFSAQTSAFSLGLRG